MICNHLGLFSIELLVEAMGRAQERHLQEHRRVDLPIWTEALFATELILLHADPVYYAWGVPRGDGSAVVLIPGLLSPDIWFMPMLHWLDRIGYRGLYSGIGFNNGCPNLMIQRQVNLTIDEAIRKTGQKVHLIGHSLGGMMARSVAAQRPDDVASVITLGAPLQGVVAHGSVLRAAESVRLRILQEHGNGVLPECYTARCTCDFADAITRCMPPTVLETAIFTEDDGVVDWRCCKTNDCRTDFSVRGTHIGLVFNPSVYRIIADRLSRGGRVP